jgi:hypothetical protein
MVSDRRVRSLFEMVGLADFDRNQRYPQLPAGSSSGSR